jgi:hypothetical protein
MLRIGNQTAGARSCLAVFQAAECDHESALFEKLLRGDAYLPPRVTAAVPETVNFASKQLAEIDVWARQNKIGTRSEAIRLLVERGLKA